MKRWINDSGVLLLFWPVMTGQNLGQMFLHEGLVMVVVTRYAALGSGIAWVTRMAGGAVNGVISVIHGMQV